MYANLVPDNWASIEITNLTHEEPLQDNQYTLICSVKTIEGMNLPLEVHWYLSDDPQNLIQTGGRLRVDPPETTGTITTLKLTFSHLLHDDGGDYTCRAKVNVSWTVSQPPVKKEVFNVVVTSKATYKTYPSFQCVIHWYYLHSSVTFAAENRTFDTLFNLEGMKSVLFTYCYPTPPKCLMPPMLIT